MEWYDGLYAEIFTALHMRKHGVSLYHFLFAENAYRFLPAIRPDRGHKVIGTFHSTPSEFKRVMRYTDHLKTLDAAIVVARSQKEMLAEFFDPARIFFVPHGVDTQYFSPPATSVTREKTCLFVGHHHRDFETLVRIAKCIRDRDSSVRIVVVDRVFRVYFTPAEQARLAASFASAGNVDLRTDLPDDELLQLYRTSGVMLLPLLEATANVAILEALSCGLPLVTNDIPGVHDYVSAAEAILASPSDADAMADHVMRILNSPEERAGLSEAGRRKALTFDWERIVAQMRSVYDQIAPV
jgi:glycosyltransferase involved in cell wall biosynthesis